MCITSKEFLADLISTLAFIGLDNTLNSLKNNKKPEIGPPKGSF